MQRLAQAYETLALRRGIALAKLAADPAARETLSDALGLLARARGSLERAAQEILEDGWLASETRAGDLAALAPQSDCEGLESAQGDAFWRKVADCRRARAAARDARRAALQAKNRAVNVIDTVTAKAESDEAGMRDALAAAREALAAGEVPVGAALAVPGLGLIRLGNAVRNERDPTAHAEIRVIREAARRLGTERLAGSTLYVTLEPCAMCAAALAHARVARVVWGAHDPAAGGMGGALDVARACHMNHHARTTGGVLRVEAEALLQEFFAGKRKTPEDMKP